MVGHVVGNRQTLNLNCGHLTVDYVYQDDFHQTKSYLFNCLCISKHGGYVHFPTPCRDIVFIVSNSAVLVAATVTELVVAAVIELIVALIARSYKEYCHYPR
jgi:hypothetical protein